MRKVTQISAEATQTGKRTSVSLHIDGKGFIWIGSNQGLERLDPATGEVSRFLDDVQDPLNLQGRLIMSIAEDDSGTLWLGTYGAGIQRFDPENGQSIRYLHDPLNPASLSDNAVYTVKIDRGGTLWAGTNAGGLNRYDQASGRFASYANSPGDQSSLLPGAIRNLAEDEAGSLWLAIDGGGLSVWHRTKTAFGYYSHDPDADTTRTGLNVSAVKAIYEDSDGIIWIGTATGGLNRLDPASGTFSYLLSVPGNPHSLTGNSLYAIFEDRAGMLWAGSYTGLNRVDRATGKVFRYQHSATDPRSLSDNFVHAITEDAAGNLWVGTSSGLNLLDRESGHFTVFMHDAANPDSLSHDQINCLYADADGSLLAGTAEGGLNRFIPKDGTWKHYRHDPGNPRSLGNDTIYGIFKDSKGIFWISTRAGLDRLDDPDQGLFTRFDRKSGLPAETVIGILEDEQGYLWLSTFNGLSRFDPRTETFKNFDQSDGLKNLEYDFYAYCRLRSGQLWFGGKRGIDIVDPRLVATNQHVPPVHITGLEINNEPVAFDGAPLRLDHLDRVVTFEFAVLNFISPRKNQYRYTLEGFDKGWVTTTGDRPFATYTNLAPGTYSFRVQGANNDGLWNETGDSIRFTIVPPWWATWWFYLFVVTATAGFIAFLYQTKASQLRTEKKSMLAVRESEEKYRILFESLPLGISVSDKSGKIVEANDTARMLTGISLDDHRHRYIDGKEWRIVRSDGTMMPSEEFASVIALREKRKVENVEMGIVKPDGEVVWISVTAAPIPLDRYGVVICYDDITIRKNNEAKIQFQSIVLDAVGEAIIATDTDGIITYFNRAAEELYGWTAADATGRNIMEVTVPEVSKEQAAAIMTALNAGRTWSGEFMVRRHDGSLFPALVSDSPVMDERGHLIGIVGVSVNIMQMKQAEEQVRKALREKEVLLQELYHRTKNNMNVIISMLSLQASYIDDPQVGAVFTEMQHRIHAMALVHQKLYQSKDLTGIDLRDYITDLVRYLMNGYSISPEKIELFLEVEPITVMIDVAVPCGLILNELISNIFKHAFPGNRTGTIRIAAAQDSGGEITLQISDNGVGVPTGFDFKKCRTLGLRTIIAITEHQLNGTIEFMAGEGVAFHIKFKNNIYAKRI